MLALATLFLTAVLAVPAPDLEARALRPAWPIHPAKDRSKCLTAESNGQTDIWSRVYVTDCNGSDNQLWNTIFLKTQLRSKADKEYCIDVGTEYLDSSINPKIRNGTPAKIRYCSHLLNGPSATTEAWGGVFESDEELENTFRIRYTSKLDVQSAAETDFCLDLQDGNVNGGNVQAWTCSPGNINQRWILGPK